MLSVMWLNQAMSFESNTELFEAIKALQVSLKESGNDKAAAIIADGYDCLNGLTDGWAQLMEALEKAKALYGVSLSSSQYEALAAIHACVKGVVCRA
jgi:hypothetical protein